MLQKGVIYEDKGWTNLEPVNLNGLLIILDLHPKQLPPQLDPRRVKVNLGRRHRSHRSVPTLLFLLLLDDRLTRQDQTRQIADPVAVLGDVLLFAAGETTGRVLGDLLVLELLAELGDLDLILLDERVRVFDDFLLGCGQADQLESGREGEGRVGFRHAESRRRVPSV